MLFEVQGFSIEEIAELQDSTASAVKSRLSRARQSLRQHYLEQCRQEDGAMDSPSTDGATPAPTKSGGRMARPQRSRSGGLNEPQEDARWPKTTFLPLTQSRRQHTADPPEHVGAVADCWNPRRVRADLDALCRATQQGLPPPATLRSAAARCRI